MTLLLHHPRWLHRLIANVGGFFWMPCDLCGRMWGGHEWHHKNQSIPDFEKGPGGNRVNGFRGGYGRGICPWCAGAGAGFDWTDVTWR